MKFFAFSLAAVALAASLSAARAEQPDPNGKLVPAAVATSVVVVEGRQAVPAARPAAVAAPSAVSAAAQYVIDRNVESDH